MDGPRPAGAPGDVGDVPPERDDQGDEQRPGKGPADAGEDYTEDTAWDSDAAEDGLGFVVILVWVGDVEQRVETHFF